ncbi:TRAP transporter large permease subunit (plasmid) [Azospirillum brasilense]|uniref:TRAP transporter large permease protein n=1 Tax=Azospirillum brasilense TaxID=192 RepID=A0A4D8QTQ2_AZOBR|nr:MULTISPECIES: TRAP transporter large permease subunit [Azospirillum]MDW7554449.1 TRAP transporter large permease subunit [Azospirillum brasilense]MDW7556322.1 TRAP transporter large permease subunit [Azospirillum brasilense]MDW7594032.1 TRAP transporter large permease subunit [Azospirillum brasilense]MDW7631696.1 TRAP transporter large permease subunit [Azospirillum brasilense]MDX5949998.1 TRAP transporter large permease subunit [Azospirillum brasilense]
MTIFIFVGSLLGAMALGLPIAFALIVSGLALMAFMGMLDPQIVVQSMWDGANSFPLLAVPFFMLAGEFMNAGGMSRRIIAMAMAWVGHLRGGLGFVAVFAAILMASLSGSAVADTAALASILLPMMRQAGYDIHRSGGLIAAGGIIAPVIPPSIGMILYGVAGQVSITKLFLAGIVPGIMMGVALLITWWWLARREILTTPPKVPLRERLRLTADAFWAMLLPVVIIGGLKTGVFTPTEAAVVAAVYAMFVGLVIYRELKIADLYGLMLSAAKTTAVVMFLVAAAGISAWLITASNIPAQLADLLAPVMDNRLLLMLALMVIVLIVGTALDFAPTILLMVPVLMPIIKQAGIDPVYFGVLFIMNNAIGLITPPVGTVLNVVCGVGRMSMSNLMKGVGPFLLAQTAVLLLLVLFPELVMAPLAWFTAR